MEFNILEMVLGQIPEALYFSLFMIFTKQLKEKRIAFILLMILEYLLLIRTMPFNLYSHIAYFIITFIILKLLYKEKAQITDVFTLAIGSILMIIVDMITYFTCNIFTNNFLIISIIDKILVFAVLFLLKNKLPKIQVLYKKLWNRNDKEKKKIKTTTFRSINVILFNISFYILNIILLYALYKNLIS